MEINTLNEILFEAISKASKIASKNPQIPTLEYVLLELINDSTLKITANNLDILYIQEVFVKNDTKDFKTQSVCVSGNLVLSYLGLFSKNDQVYINISNKGIVLTINNQKSTINGVSSVDYPKNNIDIHENIETQDEKITIPSDILIKGIQSTSFAAAITSIKPELSCIMMSITSDNMIFVATDGFRLADRRFFITNKGVSRVDLKKANLDDFKQVLVPAKIFQDCLKIIPYEVDVKISIKKGTLRINLPDGLLSLRIISGSYPNYQAIIPKEFITNIEMRSEDLLNGLKASTIFSDEFNYVKLDIEGNYLILNSKNSKIGESVFKKDIQKTGENISQSYNHRYLSDFIGKIKDETITMDISGKATPTILKVKNDPNYLYLVMPMNK